jgi:hypothetical protein
MTRKKTGMPFWNDLKVWAANNSGQYVLIEIPAESTDEREEVPPLKPSQSYFRVVLSDLSLGGSGSRMKKLSPALHACVKVKYGDRGIINLNRVVALTDEVLTARGVRHRITGLIPYAGGKVEVAAGLFALPRRDRGLVESVFDFLSDVTELETATLAGEPLVAEISANVDKGVKALMELADGHIHLGLHHTFQGTQALRPGYIAAVMAKPGQLNPELLSVREGRLFYRERPDSAPQPLEGLDYVLFQIEAREERDDWQLKSVQEPLGKAVRALLSGRRLEAFQYRTLALATACQSSDLTVADRRRLAVAINEELSSLENAGHGAVGVEERDLNQIMAARAMPLELARNRPNITLYEAMMDYPPPSLFDTDMFLPRMFSYDAMLGEDAALEILPGPPAATDKETTVDETAAVPVALQYRRFNAWVAERTGVDAGKPLVVAKTYTLKLNVGWPMAGSLIESADAVVTESEIPEEGLDTTWFLSSKNVEMGASPDDPNVKAEKNISLDGWKAEFSLHIPKEYFSDARVLLITPRATEDAEISIVILARGTLYRQFNIELKVVAAADEPKPEAAEAVKIVSEATHVPAKYTGLVPQHEWQTPPGVLRIIVQGGGKAYLLGDAVDPATQLSGPVYTVTDWGGSLADDAGPIKNLLKRADKFREEFTDELDDIAAQDLETRLSDLKSDGGRFWKDNLADPAHTQAWEQIAKSDELYKLAFDGYTLYQTIFPPKSELRQKLDHLRPGWLVNINWLTLNDPAKPAHIPWNLIYTQPPKKGQPVDPENFWGLRFRVNYVTHAIEEPRPPALGSPSETEVAYGFYWGTEDADKEIAEEVVWQKTEWAKWGKRVFVPDSSVADAAKDQLIALLNGPTQTPLFYFYCNCTVGSGNEPILRFGNSPDPDDNVELSDLGAGELAGQPLVFVNACTSSGSDPYVANELVRQFFRRSCRSYLGTEVKVPVRFASRFAKIFYSFFYRTLAPEPLAAGEAAYQARRFLWREYRNVGGLLYTYLNQYELYMATSDELSKMRSHN